MESVKKYAPFFVSALLMCVVLFIIYPHYQYYVDPDDTAYLTISKRYAAGDIQRAINGYWSPWACWLTAILIKIGIDAIPAGVIINSIGALGFLFISQSFFLCFGVNRRFQWLLNITLALFLCYAVFWQSFDDLWECFFLLSVLRLMLSVGFVKRPALWVLCGIVGTLAYFAKAYSFPFFILNTVVCVYFLSRDDKRRWLTISAVSIGVMIVCSMPWIYALHSKYGIWATSTAGTLNTSWYLVGHPIWRDGIKTLLPSPYPDSPYYWEDPWFVNGPTPHFWSSWHLFGLQFVRIGLNVWKFIVSSLQLSVFFIVIVGYAKWQVIWKRKSTLPVEMRVLMLSFLLFTVGYLLVNYESRYLWYMVPLSMVMGAGYIQRMQKAGFKKMLSYLFAISFLVYPLWTMADIYSVGESEYVAATQLKKQGVRGSFTVYPLRGHIDYQMWERFAFFSGIQFYTIPRADTSSIKGIVDDMNRYQVNYLMQYPYFREEWLPNHRVLKNLRDSTSNFSLFLVNP